MSLCTHPRSQQYADDAGRLRCACCGDVYEGDTTTGRWRPCRDSVDSPVAYMDDTQAEIFLLGLGVPHADKLPRDARIVLSTFGLALMTASMEQATELKGESDLMYRVANLAADASKRFSAGIKALCDTGRSAQARE